MAKTKLNPALAELRGAIGRLVFKRYGDQTVVSKYPDMSRVKASSAQKAQRERMQWAAYYYRSVLRNAELKARYTRKAQAQKTTVHRLATKDYMRCSKEIGRINVLSELGNGPVLRPAPLSPNHPRRPSPSA